MTPARGSRRVARAATATALAVPMGAGLLLAGVAPAVAAVQNPGDGAQYGSATTIAIRADYAASGSENRLTLTSPTGAAVVVARADANRLSGGTLSYSLDLGCWTFPSSDCRGRVPAPNGTWILAQSGGATDRTTFTTRIPPAAPTSVGAAAQSAREVRVTWARGAESDLTGFAVFEAGTVVKDGIGTSACDASRCAAVVSYPEDATGEHTYVVRSYRSVSPGSSDTLASAPSQGASATVSSNPPSPQPSPTSDPDGGQPGTGGEPSSGAPAGGGPSAPASSGSPAPAGTSAPGASSAPAGGSSSEPAFAAGPSQAAPGQAGPGQASPGQAAPGESSSQAAVSQRRAFASGFAAFGPTLGIPKLPPLPQSQPPALAEPLPDGSFAPTLGFQDQVVQERVETVTPGRRITSVVNTALDSERLARSTAGALVLLLIGGHLRRWVSSPARD